MRHESQMAAKAHTHIYTCICLSVKVCVSTLTVLSTANSVVFVINRLTHNQALLAAAVAVVADC